ncbi:MAG: hypothetical protein ACEQSB_04895 [Undibacterium sp.]
MDTCPYVIHPTFGERFSFFIERFLRMQEIGMRTISDSLGSAASIDRPLTEAELEQSELIRCSSAVKHLSWGETESRWSHDRYLDRLKEAKPELRAKALAEHQLDESHYQEWLQLYAEPQAAGH